jgi:hypothetical protein
MGNHNGQEAPAGGTSKGNEGYNNEGNKVEGNKGNDTNFFKKGGR